jgi:DNA repair exonuclease SbcCD ATPase subunit
MRKVPAGLHFFRGINKKAPRLASNGAGKSSVFDALVWVLFGKTVRGLRSPDVVPWSKRKAVPSVALEMLIDGKRRHIKRVGNVLTLDGKDVGAEHITDLLGLNYDLVNNTVVMGQGQPLFFDLKSTAKMQLFTDVLALERWEARSAYAGKEVIAGEQELAGLRGRLEGTKANLQQTAGLIKSVRASLDSWEANRVVQMESLAKDLKMLAETYEHAQARANKASLDYDGAGTELKHHVNEDAKIRNAIGEHKANLATHNANVREMERKLAEMERDAETFGVEGVCPVCGQEIAGTEFEKHKKRLDRDILAQRRVIKEAKSVDKYQNILTVLEKDLVANQVHLTKFNAKVEKARAEVDLAMPQAVEAKSKLTFMQGKTQEWESQVNPHREQLSELRKQHALLEKGIAKLSEEADTWERQNIYTKFWVKGFKDVRLYIIDDVLQELELTTNAMLEEVGLLGWSVQYDIERETKSGTVQRGLTVAIVSPESREPAKWEAWSGGEGQRLRLVGALALSDVLLNYAGVQTDLEILDEPTQHLSSTGVRDLCEWLALRSKQLQRRTLLVDHYAVDATYFNSVITVVKDERGSHIEENDR